MKKIITIISLFICVTVNASMNIPRFEGNTFYMYGNFNDASATLFSEWIKSIPLTTEDISIRINSGGGEVFALANIVATLKQFKGKVTTVNDGIAASCAFLLFLEGDDRITTRYSMFMAHGAASGGMGKMEDMLEVAARLEQINGLMKSKLKEMGLSDESVDTDFITPKDKWITFDIMEEYGLVTKTLK